MARGTRLGSDAALAFVTTGALLAVPAMLLPFVTVSKFHAERASYAISGVQALWQANMHLLAIWVFLCGVLVPLLLLGTLAGLLLPARFGWRNGAGGLLRRAARAFEQWAMPEVHVLAVLVAFAKLGSLVHVQPGPGLWCYAGMACCALAAWHSVEFYHAPRHRAAQAEATGGPA